MKNKHIFLSDLELEREFGNVGTRTTRAISEDNGNTNTCISIFASFFDHLRCTSLS